MLPKGNLLQVLFITPPDKKGITHYPFLSNVFPRKRERDENLKVPIGFVIGSINRFRCYKFK